MKNVNEFKKMKNEGKKISMLTAYDYTTAGLEQEAGIDTILVGDSLGNVMMGYNTTVPVTVDDMVHHTACVTRGANNTFVVADMPFLSYQADIKDAVLNAGRLMKEGGAQAVKLEGGVTMEDTIRAITNASIPVCAHIGLTPQSVYTLGGYKVQGKTDEKAKKLVEDALAVERAGAYMVVLECVPEELAKFITEKISIPTIGIGAGRYTDGQVLVYADMMGLNRGHKAKFVKEFAHIGDAMEKAVTDYMGEVQSGSYPSEDTKYSMDEEIMNKIREEYK